MIICSNLLLSLRRALELRRELSHNPPSPAGHKLRVLVRTTSNTLQVLTCSLPLAGARCVSLLQFPPARHQFQCTTRSRLVLECADLTRGATLTQSGTNNPARREQSSRATRLATRSRAVFGAPASRAAEDARTTGCSPPPPPPPLALIPVRLVRAHWDAPGCAVHTCALDEDGARAKTVK